MEYNEILNNWEQILNKVKNIKGETYCEIGPTATEEEIKEKELELGIVFPKSIKDVFLNFSKQVNVGWVLPNNITFIKGFEYIYSGEIAWNLDECEVKIDDHGAPERVIIYYNSIGDYIATDLGRNEFITYWYEDESKEILLARGFKEFIVKNTKIAFIAADYTQIEELIGQGGIQSENELGIRWQKYFDDLQVVQYSRDSNKLEEVISYIVHIAELRKQDLQLLCAWDRKMLSEFLLKKVLKVNTFSEQRLLCFIIGKIVKEDCKEWVQSLWIERTNISPEMRSYLSAKCLPYHIGFPLVLKYVQKEGLVGIEANSHLKYFRSNDVIQWMQEHAKLPYEGWHYLFAYSKPTWKEIVEWLYLEKHHMVIVVNAIGAMNSLSQEENVGLGYPDEPIRIKNLPNSGEVIRVIEAFKETGRLKNRHYQLDDFIDGIEKFY
ncbi:SMI1/KNR4 family protein [Bacillus cereus]|nr:SMI1/KNR4 family protein [Bacillus cereus]